MKHSLSILAFFASAVSGKIPLFGPSNCKEDSDCQTGSCVRFNDYGYTGNYCALEKGSCQGDLLQCPPTLNLLCIEGTCYSVVGQKALGEKCTAKVGDCGHLLACVSGDTCRSIEGGTCATNNDCATTRICFDGHCQLRGKKGDACKVSRQCTPPTYCSNNICTQPTLKGPGASCQSNLECRSVFCDKGVCGREGKGPCTNDSDCKSGEWCYDGGKCCPMNSPANSPCRRD